MALLGGHEVLQRRRRIGNTVVMGRRTWLTLKGTSEGSDEHCPEQQPEYRRSTIQSSSCKIWIRSLEFAGKQEGDLVCYRRRQGL